MDEYVIVEDSTGAECGNYYLAADLEDAALQALLGMGYRIKKVE